MSDNNKREDPLLAKKAGQNKERKDDPGIQEEPPLFPRLDPGKFKFSIWYFVGAVMLLMALNAYFSGPGHDLITFSEFKDKIRAGEITRVEITNSYYIGYRPAAGVTQEAEAAPGQVAPADDTYMTAYVNDPGFIELLDRSGVEYYANLQRENPILSFLLSWILPFVVLMFIWRLMFKRMGNLGQDVISFGRNRAKIVAEGETGVRFADVAGADEAKYELEEVVDFLKTPEKYTEIGGKIPKGVLLVGAPGTGKTLLARAVAGEASVPFFRMSGADFVEMFVGVGAARVRDLFRQAREKAPCIIFIDELDAIGKSRINSAAGGNDEREQTLNQLLVEMDGFDARIGVIILAATNRPEILDPALLRPGRFDRQVVVDKPDVNGREAILKIHIRGVKTDDSVDLRQIAQLTPGLVGADLASIVNEAAILAVRAGRKTVSQKELMDAIEKVMAGLEKRSRVMGEKERRTVAYHETGHALVAYHTEGADEVHKVTIVPRGIGALGYTLQLPREERFLYTERELLGKIDVLLGGRAAEQIVFGEVSTGAANDITRASDLARRMITEYGMSERFSNVYLPATRGNTYLGADIVPTNREYSEATQQYVDEETARIIRLRYEEVLRLLETHKTVLTRIAEKLLETETLTREQFEELVAEPSRVK